jgi:hypothetical protein
MICPDTTTLDAPNNTNEASGRGERGGRGEASRKRRVKTKELIPADWSVENITKLSTTLVDTGYGNWEKIRNRSRLNYSLYDIALGE